MYDRAFPENVSQYSWKMLSGDFYEPWCSVPIQNSSYLIFADFGCGNSVVVHLCGVGLGAWKRVGHDVILSEYIAYFRRE
jgi:hypothetical protein